MSSLGTPKRSLLKTGRSFFSKSKKRKSI